MTSLTLPSQCIARVCQCSSCNHSNMIIQSISLISVGGVDETVFKATDLTGRHFKRLVNNSRHRHKNHYGTKRQNVSWYFASFSRYGSSWEENSMGNVSALKLVPFTPSLPPAAHGSFYHCSVWPSQKGYDIIPHSTQVFPSIFNSSISNF